MANRRPAAYLSPRTQIVLNRAMSQIKDGIAAPRAALYVRFTCLGLLIGIGAVLAVVQAESLRYRFVLPTGSDEDAYLLAGDAAVKTGLLLHRAPLYTLWHAMLNRIAYGNLDICFILAKELGHFGLSLAAGLLAWRLLGLASGVFFTSWILNCKYILAEPNGTHAFAGTFWLAGMVMLCGPPKPWRRPASLGLMTLSTQIRSDMWAPAAVAMILILSEDLREYNILSKQAAVRKGLSWLSAGLVTSVAVFALLHQSGPPEQSRFSEAFRASYAVAAVERGLIEARPGIIAWHDINRIWLAAMPAANSLGEALRRYPVEVASYIWYQIVLSMRVIPAVSLVPDNLRFAEILLAAWLVPILAWPHLFAKSPPRDIVWAGFALFALIPPSCIIRVAARNYIQLAPVVLFSAVFGLRWFASAVARNLRRST